MRFSRRIPIPFRLLKQLLLTVLIFLLGFFTPLLFFRSFDSSVSLLGKSSYNKFMPYISPRRTKRYKDYCVIENVIARKNLNDYEHITLVVHISNDYLDYRIVEQVQSWDGPVSLAIVLPETKTAEAMVETEDLLLQYSPLIDMKLSAHIIYKSDQQCIYPMSNETSTNVSNPYIYPVNIARNVARMMAQTKYILIADYEHIFSNNFEPKMLLIANSETKKNPKIALVFRMFEVDDRIKKMPRDRKALNALIKSGQAIQFHERYVGRAHTITGLQEWLTKEEPNNEPSVDRIIPYLRRNWEPQFVTLSDIPFHDENFPYPIRDNTVLRWEMCRKNYSFALVNDLFAVHPGIKRRSRKTESLKRIALKQFRKAIVLFRKRMQAQYPETVKKCPAPGY